MLKHWIIPGGCPGFFRLWVLGPEVELVAERGVGPA